MKTLVFAVLLGTVPHDAAARIHSMKSFYTASSGVPNFPEFVIVKMVDEVQMFYYDSNTSRAEPKQDWMKNATAEDPHYWKKETQIAVGNQQVFKVSIPTVKRLFNQTGDVHTFQWTYGCEWDDETDEVVKAFDQVGYDGEDYISFDLKTETWTAPPQQALLTKYYWDHDKAYIAQKKDFLTKICPDWVKELVDYGRSSLMRTELPSVSLLQQTPSSPVRCFASGFYPERASLFWRKDGDDLHEDVELGEILPNDDGTFQMSVDLNISSVTPEDWRRYECVFQLSGVKDDIVTKLNKTAIRTNWRKTETPSNMAAITAAVVVVALVLIVAVGIAAGYKLKKKKEDSESSNECTAVNVQVEQPLMKDQQASSSSSSSGSQEEVH